MNPIRWLLTKKIPDGWGVRSRNSPYCPELLAHALHSWCYEYCVMFHANPNEIMQKMDRATLIFANKLIPPTAAGLTYLQTGNVFLKIKPNLANTAFSHEMVHIVEGPDPQHKSMAFEQNSDFIARVNLKILEFNAKK